MTKLNGQVQKRINKYEDLQKSKLVQLGQVKNLIVIFSLTWKGKSNNLLK